MSKPISVQLYSLREAAAANGLTSVVESVAEIGYKGVEPAGFWELRPSEFRHIVEDLGMKVYSAHSPWAHGVGNIGECMELASILGLQTIVCGYGPDNFKDMAAIERTAENTRKMLEVAKRNGFTLFQHNHDFEFQRLDGRLKYDIYRELVPGIKFQIDCFWSTNLGREDPVEILKKYASDTILIHMKDGVCQQQVGGKQMVNGILERKVDLLPLGTGTLPIPELVKAMPEQVQTIVVELDFCNIDMLEALKMSYKYMTENGFAQGNR